MPWKDCTPMSLREEFVRLAEVEGSNLSLLCRRFGISRKCGYKWLSRYAAGGGDVEALADRSRRPHGSPRRTQESMEQLVVQLRRHHPAWGPRKLRRVLLNQGQQQLPAASTMGEILVRHGLVLPEQSQAHQPMVRFEKRQPNELWQMDFKGHVPMLDGGRCHPLTVLDDHSRYNLGLVACGNEQTGTVQQSLIGLFERYGQPQRILCDNGSPWGSSGGEPYTQLGVWLLLHGIGVSHGRPRHPQTQGKEERFHRTLCVELLSRCTLRDLDDSQRQFDAFRRQYNQVRPHEALELNCPVSRYRPSPRAYEATVPPPQYDCTQQVRKVDAAGWLSFRGRSWKIGKAFIGQRLGLSEGSADGMVKVMLGQVELGLLDERGELSRLCCAEPPVATLPAAQHSTEESVTHVSGHL